MTTLSPLHPEPPSHDPQEVSVLRADVAADAAAVSAARRRVASWVERAGFAGRTEDVALVVSELLANSAEAGAGAGVATPVTLEVTASDQQVVVEVSNAPGVAFDRWPDVDHDDPLRERGRGLVLARALASSLQLVSRRGRDVVRATLTA